MLLLNNEDVQRLLDMSAMVDAIDEAYKELADGHAVNLPEGGRMDVMAPSPGAELDRSYIWGAMASIVRSRGIFALRMKSDIMYTQEHDDGGVTLEKYCVQPGTYCGLVMLFSIANAEPLAIINDGVIQHARVAATSAVASRYLARPDSSTIGMLGSGGMARSHAEAFAAVHSVKRINVYSPTKEHREEYAREMSAKLEIEVVPVNSEREAVIGADIVTGCSDSLLPVIKNEWVVPGMHLTCVLPSEIERSVEERCDIIVRHVNGGAYRVRAATDDELTDRQRQNPSDGLMSRTDLPILEDLVSGRAQSRTRADQLTYYANTPGSAVQFAAAGSVLYNAAREQGLGRELPTEWFLQNIRD